MKFPRILFILVFCFSLSSCQNGVNEKRTGEPNKSPIPSTEYKKRGKSNPKLEQQKSIEKPVDQEAKKKKVKAMDTLKPVTAIP
ncbi:hypothetical protein [Maribacter sp. 2308TA10-17]|uniref:hypothetical protein n=1 Tax=Maribacter sp. 2308TA10-17 TaxID=3386276 RepID=UPI0039BD4AEC